MTDPSPPLGDHYFYYATAPCPTEIVACHGEYTGSPAAASPGDTAGRSPVSTPVLGHVRCGAEDFQLVESRGLVGVTRGAAAVSLVTYTPTETHHVTVACNQVVCSARRFATRDEAVAALQLHACRKTANAADGEIAHVQLRVPFTRFRVDAGGHSYDAAMVGVGFGARVLVPRSWYVPLSVGGVFEWLTGSPNAITGPDAEMDLTRLSVMGEAGVVISAAWIHALAYGPSAPPLPFNVSLSAVYRFGYERFSGTYRFPQVKPVSIDEGDFRHYPALVALVDIPLGHATVSAVGVGFDESFAGLSRGGSTALTDSVDHHAPTVTVGLGRYTTAVAIPAPLLAAPDSARHYPLEDQRASLARRRPPEGVGVELRPVELEDVWGFIFSATLYYETNGTGFRGNVDHELHPLLSAVSEATMRRPQAGHLSIRYLAYTDSRDDDPYNLILSRERAAVSIAALDPHLRAHVDFGPLMRDSNVTVKGFGFGEAHPIDASGRPIDTAGCAEVVSDDRLQVTHRCGTAEIAEDLGKSRRLEVVIQAERDDSATHLYDLPPQPSPLAAHATTLPEGITAYPLDLAETDTAAANNFLLIQSLPRRRAVSVIVSGATPMDTDSQVEQLRPAIRAARHVNIEVLHTVEPLGKIARAFVLVHPDVKLALQGVMDPRTQSILQQLGTVPLPSGGTP